MRISDWSSDVCSSDLLTKSDKVKASELAETTAKVKAEARTHGAAHPQILATSSEKGGGIAELRAAVIEAVEDCSGGARDAETVHRHQGLFLLVAAGLAGGEAIGAVVRGDGRSALCSPLAASAHGR